MRKIFENVLDVISAYIKSLIAQKDRSYYELSDSSEEKKNPIKSFLYEKIRIKMDVEISRGVLILIAAAFILLLIFIIKGLLKSSKK